ncbi:MAG: hypothetical protein OXT65_02040 [Alphaproteobacteria bacterium]|nr:hypothetical protein [Alphaproteobacteria bacterium]
MTANEVLGGLAVVTGLCFYATYFYGIWRGQIRPHAYTWLVFSILNGIGFAALHLEGGGPGAWTLGVTSFASFVTFVIGLLMREKDITRSDTVALVFALLAIPVWVVTDNALWAVIIISCIDVAALYPTFRKSWHKPHEEGALSFTLSGVEYSFALAALQSYSVITVLYPATIVVVDGLLVLMLLYRRRQV